MPDSKAVARVLATGYIFDAKAFDMINGLPAELDVDSFVDRLLALKAAGPSEARMITEEDVAKALPPGSASDGRKERAPVEEEVELEVVSDPTPAISPIEANEGC